MDDRHGRAAWPLIRARSRRPAALVLVGCIVLVTVLGMTSAHSAHANGLNQPIDFWIEHHLRKHLLQPLILISHLGKGPEVTVMTVVLAALCLGARRLNGTILAAVSVPVAAFITEYVLKPLVHETIAGDNLSYPSGHMTALFALTAGAAVILLDPPGGRLSRAVRIGIVATLVIIDTVVAAALITMEYHYFTDIIAGAAVGIGVVLTCAFLLDISVLRRRLAITYRSRRPAPEPDQVDEVARRG